MAETDPTDRELLDAFRCGDGDAFETLYHRHRDWVVRVARRFLGDSDEALDVMQDVFAHLIDEAPRLDLRHRLTTYLYPVVKNRAIDRRRRRARRPGPLDPARDAPVDEALPGLPDDVRDWFRGLGPLQQEVLGLRFADELDLDEIAAILDVPLGTVKSRLHNALRMLRKKFEDQ